MDNHAEPSPAQNAAHSHAEPVLGSSLALTRADARAKSTVQHFWRDKDRAQDRNVSSICTLTAVELPAETAVRRRSCTNCVRQASPKPRSILSRLYVANRFAEPGCLG